jgi:hypothetical protein
MAETELARALARVDADFVAATVDAYAAYFASGERDWPDKWSDAFSDLQSCYHDDPDKALAYVVIGASRSDDASFVGFLGCGPLEDLLHSPSDHMLDRIVAEARRSTRFRWLLSNPFKVAVSEAAWQAIEPFRSTGPHEEPPYDTLPPCDL